MKTKKPIFKFVATAIFLAIIVVLQVISNNFRIGPFAVTLTPIPIVIGALLFGPEVGVILGLGFGLISLIDSGFFWAMNPFATIVICLVKGVLTGLVPGLLFNLFKEKHYYLGAILCSVIAPIINTLTFVLLASLLLYPNMLELSGGTNVIAYVITAFVAPNFIFEFVACCILSPSVPIIYRIITKERHHK